MNACIGVGRLDEAAALLDAAVAAGVRLDARAYNVLLKGHARAGDPDALAGIMEQMQRAQACAMPLVLYFGMLACRPTGMNRIAKGGSATIDSKPYVLAWACVPAQPALCAGARSVVPDTTRFGWCKCTTRALQHEKPMWSEGLHLSP